MNKIWGLSYKNEKLKNHSSNIDVCQRKNHTIYIYKLLIYKNKDDYEIFSIFFKMININVKYKSIIFLYIFKMSNRLKIISMDNIYHHNNKGKCKTLMD